ncbi:class I SAM-dependent methyltransferase [Pseudoduganella violaceinigra]|uniref:class I SAM-dependent methyltransferase n=1 Tax=Pseudoduganella violaceinigra TaxID=246602 RepID=UPI000407E7AD|nr:class I SAM-dependent methyltransferase [Pseudoduganella violaceinigra]
MAVAINHAAEHAKIDEDARETSLKALRQESFRTIVALTRQFAAPHAHTLLDVGSAHGWFLETATGAFEAVGVEPDEAVAAKCIARGVPVRIGYFPQALADGERFDVIVFNDVIEHIPDIRSALRNCHERLSPNGTLVLNLPSSRGLFYRLSKLFARVGLRGPFDRLWQKGMPSPHVHYFNPVNLTKLVESEGFELRHNTEMEAVKVEGLWQRLTMFGNVHRVKAALQYVCIRWGLRPLTGLFPSDIIVCIYRKR